MANRCLSSRTNAWTDVDHTCYTVYTAGPSGFINILPVYMDHILHPVLRDEDFLTEVHHISAEGEDAGVVYSEMQVMQMSPLYDYCNIDSLILFSPRLVRIPLPTFSTSPWSMPFIPEKPATKCLQV